MSFWQGQEVLVTGGAGFIGSHLVEQLVKADATVTSAADPCNPEPTNYGYGVAKWAGEKLAQSFHREYGVPVGIVRFSNAFGPRDYYDETAHVTPAFIRRAMVREDPFIVWGTGEQSRVLVDARDLARACLIVAEKGADGQPTNIGHRQETRIKDLARLVLKLTGHEAGIVFDATKPDGHDRRLPDLARFERLSGGWLPDTPLGTTLKDMIADYRERYG